MSDKPLFIDADFCTSGQLCEGCRTPWAERMRLRLGEKVELPPGAPPDHPGNFPCPPERGAKPWGFKWASITARKQHLAQYGRGKPVPQRQQRPSRLSPTALGKALTALRTIVRMPRVSEAIAQERAAICAACPLARQDDQGLWCSVCGCGVSADARRVLNLAAYEERVKVTRSGRRVVISGCKHPQRGKSIDPARPDGPNFGWPLDYDPAALAKSSEPASR